MNNPSPYLISGKRRKELKKELHALKRIISQSPRYDDFVDVLGGVKTSKKDYERWCAERDRIERLLNIPCK